jgi:serine/threonine protein kinase
MPAKKPQPHAKKKASQTRKIAKGAYGCIYKPPMTCEGAPVTSDKDMYVSKVQRQDYTMKELKSVEAIRQIPGWRYYFLIPEEQTCRPAPEYNSLIKECDTLTGLQRKDITFVDIKYGGKPLSAASFPITKFNIRIFLIHMIEALILLQNKGIAHADLHMGNILIDESTLQTKIIDFGQAISITEQDEGKIHRTFEVFDKGYEQMPPECLFISGIRQYTSLQAHQILNLIPNMRRAFNSMFFILGYSPAKQQEHYESWANSWLATPNPKDIVAFWNEFSMKYDIWSIGIATLTLIKHFRSISPNYDVDENVINVLRKICHMDPRKRFTAHQALNMLRY